MWKTKISHIIEVYDGYTGQPADAGQFRIVSSEKVDWMPKDNGCIVFCNCWGTEIELSLESRRYLKKHIFLKHKAGDGQAVIQRVWVFPGQAYGQSKWDILKQGEAPPLCRVEFFPIMTKDVFRLLKDVGMQDVTLSVFHRKYESLEGREILLYPKQIRLILGKETEPFCFVLGRPMGIEIKKSDARVILGYKAIAQADGSFEIAVPGNRSNLEKSILYLEGSEQEIIHHNSKEV